MNKKAKGLLRKFGLVSCTLALSGCLTVSAMLSYWKDSAADAATENSVQSNIAQIKANNALNIEDYLSESTTQKLNAGVNDDELISIIIRLPDQSVLEAYNASGKVSSYASVADYELSKAGASVITQIDNTSDKLQKSLKESGVQYTLGYSYHTLFGGFEIVTKAKYFDKVCSVLNGKATVIVGDVYAECETQVVTNEVNVYDTGIFDSSNSKYDGSGVVVAVLDTGLDYTHSAFSVDRFEGEEVFTLNSLSSRMSQLAATEMAGTGLSAEDVYINKKVPFAYDYADNDSDVFPINSEHGTHVSGIIVGNDDVIMGVAPNAQLAFMKVFSDEQSGARTSWILAGVNDCVKLGVDVINMSLGSAAGFSREVDKENIQQIYDAVKEQGISLVTAAGNDYNSTYGSSKNGNLGLTSNPDSSVVGSPSTYEAALSVASISGVESPYLTSSETGDTPIYVTESSATGLTNKKFVDDIFDSLNVTGDSVTLEYVTVPGIGRSADYGSGDYALDVRGKIVLIRRGTNSFEDKARIAKEKGAAACIIYNNVSGSISMSVGMIGNYPVCSISQDNGEVLAAKETGGTITISRSQVAGPFMSDFSSWGPSASLGIKPEITAHGGEIYSAVPGQSYDRLSGTSMASPNQAGVTALLRQYVQEEFDTESDVEIAKLVNQIMMSTTDIVKNKIGLAYSVRKQGAGLANLDKATGTPAYLRTYDKYGEEMDKTKLELGDDPQKTGVYTMTFDLVNVKSASLSYDVGAIVLTEGVSATLTNKGLTTVTEEGYTLGGASISVSATGGSVSGNTVSVSGNQTAKVTVTITLSNEDKAYLDSNFANGMYVEGFLTFTAKSGTTVDLNVPYLAFYGDWTVAPLFDIDYFETNKDELDDSIDLLDKTLPDAYATTPLGGTYRDFIVQLGSFAFTQDPAATKISADRKYIALSNQATGDSSAAVNSIYAIYAGMLRSAKRIEVSITDAVTGEAIFEKTVYNQRKSYSSGSTIYPSSVDIGFNVADYDLKNNTQYLFKMQGYLDYENDGAETNLNNTFEFPFTIDFQAPILTGASFHTEYDKDNSKYRLYADLSIYDNHYSQAAMLGVMTQGYSLSTFDRYMTTLYSDFNSTTSLTYDLTDHIDEIKSSYNGNSFLVYLYDYAFNTACYEVSIPDDVAKILFMQNGEELEELNISVNETFALNDILQISPSEAWVPSLNFETSNASVIRVVNGKLLGISEGTATLTAISNSNPNVRKSITVNVGTDRMYDKPVADSFALTAYEVNKVFYFNSSSDRDLNATAAGAVVQFTSSNYSLSMYPSESVTLQHVLYAYFPGDVTIQYQSNNASIATIDENGTIVAQSEGETAVTVRVLMDGKSTFYSQTVYITVKNPFVANSIYLMSYMGLGGTVEIPAELGVSEIYQYAFSNYEYVAKDENDEISEEDPYYSKITYIGEDTITKVIIPEGVKVIDAYAFAGLTALEEVVLPSTLTKIQNGAFINCTSLRQVTFSGKNGLQFINNDAFYNCTALAGISLSSIVAIGDRAFMNSGILEVGLPATAQSIGAQTFYHCPNLVRVSIGAEKVKLGTQAFAECSKLGNSIYGEVVINASVIPAGLFEGCTALTSVTIGKDVSVINHEAFAGTSVSSFKVAAGNDTFTAQDGGAYLLLSDGVTLALVAPTVKNFTNNTVTKIGSGAFSGNVVILSISLPKVTAVEDYAFAGCSFLRTVELGELTQIGEFAFYGTELTSVPKFASSLESIGAYAFFGTNVTSVSIPDGVTVGDYAFAQCSRLATVSIGNDAVLGAYAFAAGGQTDFVSIGSDSYGTYYYVKIEYASSLTSLTIGNGAKLGFFSFLGADVLESVSFGTGVTVGDGAFYNCEKLTAADLSKVVSVGNSAFSGDRFPIIVSGSSGIISLGYYADQFLEDMSLTQATGLTSISLDACTYVGEYAFALCPLVSVTLGEELNELGAGAFYLCTELANVDLANVSTVGIDAFAYNSSLSEIDLRKVQVIGAESFLETALVSVTLKEGAYIGGAAFAYCLDLETVNNLNKAVYIGEYAFAFTSLESADLSEALYLGDMAFAYTLLTSVKLGDKLEAIGENPFVACAIPEFTNSKGENTYTIGENVSVIEGVLYRKTANGYLELITYPFLKENTVFEVAEGTVRIGQLAFFGSSLISVELGREVRAIGDSAFYACYNLTVVTFNSISSPILEEQYTGDSLTSSEFFSRLLGTDILLTSGSMQCLGLVPFTVWSSEMSNILYGANFVSEIGSQDLKAHTLIMVAPNNGTGYDSFIMNQYFKQTIAGKTAISDAAFALIQQILLLPSSGSITLNDEAAVVAARTAYNILPAEQQALLAGSFDGVNYVATLTSLENILIYLHSLENQEKPPVEEAPEDGQNVTGLYVAIGILAALSALLAGALVAVILGLRKGRTATVEAVEAKPAEEPEAVEVAKDTQSETEESDTSDKE